MSVRGREGRRGLTLAYLAGLSSRFLPPLTRTLIHSLEIHRHLTIDVSECGLHLPLVTCKSWGGHGDLGVEGPKKKKELHK